MEIHIYCIVIRNIKFFIFLSCVHLTTNETNNSCVVINFTVCYFFQKFYASLKFKVSKNECFLHLLGYPQLVHRLAIPTNFPQINQFLLITMNRNKVYILIISVNFHIIFSFVSNLAVFLHEI